jgi:hypothetical protein
MGPPSGRDWATPGPSARFMSFARGFASSARHTPSAQWIDRGGQVS